MRLVLVTASVLLALGCVERSGNDDEESEGGIARCRVICQSARGCPGADPDLDCTNYCFGLDSIIIAGRCRTRFNTLLDCDEALADICTESVDCREELTDYSSCISAYCEDHMAECDDVFGQP